MVMLEEHGTERRELTTPKGSVRLYTLSPTVYVAIAVGHMEKAHAELIVAYGDERIRRAAGAKIHAFQNWLEMTGYDSSCRQLLTAWSRQRRSDVAAVHLALRSKIVAMGVQVANLALDSLIRTHTDRARLEVELRRTLGLPIR